MVFVQFAISENSPKESFGLGDSYELIEHSTKTSWGTKQIINYMKQQEISNTFLKNDQYHRKKQI